MIALPKIDWGKWLQVWSVFCLDATQNLLDEIGATTVVINHLEDLKDIGRRLIQDYCDNLLSETPSDFQELSPKMLRDRLSETEIEEFCDWINSSFIEFSDLAAIQSMQWDEILLEMKDACSSKQASSLIINRQEQVLCPVVSSYFLDQRALRNKLNDLSDVQDFSSDDQKYIQFMDYIHSCIAPTHRDRSFIEGYNNMIFFVGNLKNIERVRSLLKIKLEKSEMVEIIKWASHRGLDEDGTIYI
ncbi:MAG: hypothetical protein ACRYFS_09680 [Janthinobacterium lividum]